MFLHIKGSSDLSTEKKGILLPCSNFPLLELSLNIPWHQVIIADPAGWKEKWPPLVQTLCPGFCNIRLGGFMDTWFWKEPLFLNRPEFRNSVLKLIFKCKNHSLYFGNKSNIGKTEPAAFLLFIPSWMFSWTLLNHMVKLVFLGLCKQVNY